MKKLILISLLSFFSASAIAVNVSVQTNPNPLNVKHDKVFIDVRDAGSYLRAGGVYIYHNPQARYANGRYDQIFVSSTNGTAFCRAMGHRARNTSGDGGSITCGEDESSYAEYNFSTRRWVSKNTGGSNQCYPLYKTIECK